MPPSLQCELEVNFATVSLGLPFIVACASVLSEQINTLTVDLTITACCRRQSLFCRLLQLFITLGQVGLYYNYRKIFDVKLVNC